jgi:hypothetical protein
MSSVFRSAYIPFMREGLILTTTQYACVSVVGVERGSQSCRLEGWRVKTSGAWVLRKDTAQVPLRREAAALRQRHPNIDFSATRGSLVTAWRRTLCLLSCFVPLYCVSSLLGVNKEELDEKLIGSKMSLETEKFHEFHLIFLQYFAINPE